MLVAVSTALSTNESVPSEGGAELLGIVASTLIGSAVFLSTAGRYCAGTEKLAKMGRIWLIVTSGSSSALIRLPALTLRLPVRPPIGEVMVQ